MQLATGTGFSITTLRNISRMAAGAVATSLTNLEPAALQELRVEQHFGLIKKHAQGSPTLKDLIMGTAKEHARQACILRSMTAEELPTAFTTQARDAISEGEPPRWGQEALGCAIQLQCFISKDLTPSDCYFLLLDFWQRHGGAKLFGQCDSGADAAEACQEAEVEEDILPGDVEVLPADAAQSSQDAAKRNDNGLSTITSVQARAAVTEQVEHALAVLADPERQSEATDDEPANLDVPRFDLKALEDMMMAEVAESGDADEQREQGAETPKTLLQLLKQVLRQGGAEFNIGEASSAGTHACLKRIHSMIGPIRRFTRLVRLQEGLVSLAKLERCQVPLNEHNARMHELSLARQPHSLSQVRLSRAEQWSKAQASFVKRVKIQNSKVTSGDPGISVVKDYRSSQDPKIVQVVLFNDASNGVDLTLGAVLAVYRGSIVRKQGSPQLGQVRVSKPVPELLNQKNPFSCCAVIMSWNLLSRELSMHVFSLVCASQQSLSND